MKKMKNIKLWVPVLIWAGVIFGFSSISINSNAEFSWIDFIFKKTAHVVEYAILYWLVYRATTQKGNKTDGRVFLKILIVVVLYALSDEWHQTFVPGREGTLRDVGFDTIGALLSLNQIKRSL